MNVHKILFSILLFTHGAAFTAATPTPSPVVEIEPLDLGGVMAMPCIDDRVSSGMRGATGDRCQERRVSFRKLAAPVQQFDKATFRSFVQAFNPEQLEAFLKKQPSALLRANIDRPLGPMGVSALQYVAMYGQDRNDSLCIARILLRYGACAMSPMIYTDQLKQSPIKIVKAAYLRRYEAKSYWDLPARFVDPLSSDPLSAAQLAALRVGPGDVKYVLFKLLELFSGHEAVDRLADGLATLSTSA